MQLDFFEKLEAFQHDNNVKEVRDQLVKRYGNEHMVKLADEVLEYRKQLPILKKENATLTDTVRRLKAQIDALGDGTNEELIARVGELNEELRKAVDSAVATEEARLTLQKRYEQSMLLSGAQHDFLAGLLRKHGIW